MVKENELKGKAFPPKLFIIYLTNLKNTFNINTFEIHMNAKRPTQIHLWLEERGKQFVRHLLPTTTPSALRKKETDTQLQSIA